MRRLVQVITNMRIPALTYIHLTSPHSLHSDFDDISTFTHSLFTIDDLPKLKHHHSFQSCPHFKRRRFKQFQADPFKSIQSIFHHTLPAPWLLIDALPITPAQKRPPTSVIRLKKDRIQYCVVYLSPLVLPCKQSPLHFINFPSGNM